MKTTDKMTLQEFTAVFESLQDEGRDKEATILATVEEELYTRYWVEVCGEELE
jgi:hypothetical protein